MPAPAEVTCPSCHRVLLISGHAAGPSLTCPHCLALVVNPRALVRTDLPAGPPAREADETTCPGCGRPVEPGWRVCPHCGEPLRRRPAAPKGSLDDEVRRDSRGGLGLAVTLIVLVVIGLVLLIGLSSSDLVSSSKEGPAVLGVGILVLGVIAVGVAVALFTSKSTAARTVTGVLGGLAVGAGAVLLVVTLLCLAVFAAIFNFLETCAKCGK